MSRRLNVTVLLRLYFKTFSWKKILLDMVIIHGLASCTHKINEIRLNVFLYKTKDLTEKNFTRESSY